MKYRLKFQASIALKRTKSKIRDRSSRKSRLQMK